MSKQIRLTDGVYIVLDSLREKRETFSEVVERIIKTHVLIAGIRNGLPPLTTYRRGQKRR